MARSGGGPIRCRSLSRQEAFRPSRCQVSPFAPTDDRLPRRLSRKRHHDQVPICGADLVDPPLSASVVANFRALLLVHANELNLCRWGVASVIRKNPRGDLPVVHDSAFVDPTAILCGRVIVRENVFIGPYAVIRADEVDANGQMEPIVIGAHSNIQDGVVIHSKSGAAVTIGEQTSIAHRAIVHGPCTVGAGVFIGFNSVLFNCAVVDGCDLPPGFYVPSTQRIGPTTDLATVPKVTADTSEFSEDVVRTNNSLVQGYKSLQSEL